MTNTTRVAVLPFCWVQAAERKNEIHSHGPGLGRRDPSINELGGKVVIFSANLDHRNYENLSKIKLDGITRRKPYGCWYHDE